MTASQKKKAKKIILHYLYAAAVSAAALYVQGETNWRTLANAALLGVLGPLVGAVNPKVTDYGPLPKE